MSLRTGLLVSCNPNNVVNLFKQWIQRDRIGTLYVKLLCEIKMEMSESSRRPSQELFRKTVIDSYDKLKNENVDVRVLLSNFHFQDLKTVTSKPVEVLYFDRSISTATVSVYIRKYVTNLAANHTVMFYDNESNPEMTKKSTNLTSYDYVILGGTFDKLHVGHKILLSEAVMKCHKKLTVGVMDDSLLQSKILPEFIDNCETRVQLVTDFLKDVDPNLEYNVVPIYDIYGPTKTDPLLQLLVVSTETIGGGNKVNEYRKEVGLNELIVDVVDLVDSERTSENEESKASSSNYRMRMLGTLLKSPEPRPDLPSKPYIIGLTGGIASGKSSISDYMKSLGCGYINCDEIGHDMYKTGTEGYEFIRSTFGSEILNEDESINRQKLSAMVFENKELLDKLSSGLWPIIQKAVKQVIYSTYIDKQVVVIEAALLIKANWTSECHEVWSCIIPPKEAVKRLQSRNNLSIEDAQKRIDSQPANKEYVVNSNVVFCSLWDTEYTRKQVKNAWDDLQKRLPKSELKCSC